MIDNINCLLGNDLKKTFKPGSRLKIAASCFSIYAFEALKAELCSIESLQFIFTAPTFVPTNVTDRLRKERREFFIPKARRESGLYGTEFEIQLRNKLTQRAVARECAAWIRKKAKFKSNTSKAPMQQFMHVDSSADGVAYMPISGFTAVDLGYQKGDAVSNFVTKFDDPNHSQMYLQLFNQIWADPEKVKDVTDAICDHIESVYQENSPERIYFMMLYNIFQDFLEDIDQDVLPNDGDYNPDWAISFREGGVKHIYFVAETKGSMSTMKLREIEKTKIECARKFFDEISRKISQDKVKYEVVTDYAKLMDIVGRAA